MTAVLDLFAGPGGWDEGASALGLAPLGVEIDGDACRTAEAAGHARVQADVSAISPSSFGTVTGLIASPPCPGFSSAGRGRGRADLTVLLQAVPALEAGDPAPDLWDRVADLRSLLALEPLRWALELLPDWTAWEQVPQVLPLWRACGAVLERAGYAVSIALVDTETYGLPQTRRRAFLLARRRGGAPAFPTLTHSRWHQQHKGRLDSGVLPWVTMSDALGWARTDRVGFPRRADQWCHQPVVVDGVAYRERDLHPAGARPAPCLTEKARSWKRWSLGAESFVPVTLTEASVLQGFRPDYPWSGYRTKAFLQLADAVPPPLSSLLLSAVTGLPVQEAAA